MGSPSDYIKAYNIIYLALNHMTTITFVPQELATKNDIAPLASKTDLLELKVDIVKWVGALMLAQVAVIAALVKLL